MASPGFVFLEAKRLFRGESEHSSGDGGHCSTGADNQTGLNDNFFWIRRLRRSGNTAQERVCRDQAHFAERLPYRRMSGILKCSALNVVEAHDRDVFGNPPARFTKRMNRANRGYIIKCKECGERLARGEKFLRRTESQRTAVSELNSCPLMKAMCRCPNLLRCSNASVAA